MEYGCDGLWIDLAIFVALMLLGIWRTVEGVESYMESDWDE